MPISRQLEVRHLPSGQKSFMIDSHSSNLFIPEEDKQLCTRSTSALVVGAAPAAAAVQPPVGCGDSM